MQLCRWDIFCRVIDNFGDIGVSWRLARQLAADHHVKVRLWIDQIASLHALLPSVDRGATRQILEGVEVFQYTDASAFPTPADVVIEAFGCGVPQSYVRAMAECEAPPLWIVLEYLSAEPWVRDYHGRPSPHPQLGLPRYFFFPGFAEGTGGLLCEADLLVRRDAFDGRARSAWWRRMGFDDVAPEAIAVSLFSYTHAPFQALLQACAQGESPVVVAVPEGTLAQRARNELHIGAESSYRAGNLELRFVPFVPQTDYDELLWTCDINFVRGEDSFVRAQWAGRPFVWHIYPQQEDAHVVKLDAFLRLYSNSLPVPAAAAVHGLWHAWNGVTGAPTVGDAWRAFNATLPAQRDGLQQWQRQLAQAGDVAGNLLRFCRKMI